MHYFNVNFLIIAFQPSLDAFREDFVCVGEDKKNLLNSCSFDGNQKNLHSEYREILQTANCQDH